MMPVVFLFHFATTLAMTGLIWFVHVVHYPLLAQVDAARFVDYASAHRRLTTWVVAPLMVVELCSGIALIALLPYETGVWIGLGLLAVVWLVTALAAVPQHDVLSVGFDPLAHKRLMRANAMRAVAWSARSALLLGMATQVLA